MKRFPAALILIGAIVGVGLAGCGARSIPDPPPQEPVVSVRTHSLEIRTFSDSVVVPGQWSDRGEIIVAAPFAGMVDSIGVRVGDRVPAGRILCWLVTRESRAALQGAELLLRQARDPVDRNEASRAVEVARRDLVRVPLAAPRAGLVLRRSLEPGAEVAESGEILALVPADAVGFEARVPSGAASRVSPGQRAVISVPGAAPRGAVVEQVLPMAGEDQTTPVWLVPQAISPPPELGRFGTVTIFLAPSRRALAVPDSALVIDDLTGQARIALVTPQNRIIWTPIRLGIASGGWHEIEGPAMKPGAQVVVEGQRALPDSTRVQIAP